jgi:alpha-glucosidase
LQEPLEQEAYRIDDQFFVGDDLMVAPLFNDTGDRTLYLPRGLWYDFFGEDIPKSGRREITRKSTPLNRLPVYVRAGGIIPLGPAMQHTAEKPVDPLSIHIFGFSADDTKSGKGNSHFQLYEDDGSSTEYRRGKFRRTNINFQQSVDAIKVEISAESGDRRYRAVPSRGYTVHFHGVHEPVRGVRLNGKVIPRTDTAKRPLSAPYWEFVQGDIVVFLPRSSARKYAVEFATAARWN